MAVRTLEQLRRDQGTLLQELQSGAAGGGSFAAPEAASGPTLRIAKVTHVITSHATYGPHLVIKPQSFAGQPPVASDTSAPARRVYPTPNRTVGDYAVHEVVAVAIARGAEFAMKLS